VQRGKAGQATSVALRLGGEIFGVKETIKNCKDKKASSGPGLPPLNNPS
jgi:hypothetical protein